MIYCFKNSLTVLFFIFHIIIITVQRGDLDLRVQIQAILNKVLWRVYILFHDLVFSVAIFFV